MLEFRQLIRKKKTRQYRQVRRREVGCAVVPLSIVGREPLRCWKGTRQIAAKKNLATIRRTDVPGLLGFAPRYQITAGDAMSLGRRLQLPAKRGGTLLFPCYWWK